MDQKPIHCHHCNILKKNNLLSFENFGTLCFLKLIFKCIIHLAPDRSHLRSTLQTKQRQSYQKHHKSIYCRTTFTNLYSLLKTVIILDVSDQ